VSYIHIDFEASGLDGSYPVEFAFVLDDGLGDASLIRPEASWTHWDDEAERIHGISRDRLLAEGIPAADVARRAAVILGEPGTIVLSDAPEWDGAWLGLLLSTLPSPPRIQVWPHCHALSDELDQLYDLVPDWLPSAGGRRAQAVYRIQMLGRQIVERAQEAERQRGPIAHRALPDAESLWRVWRNVKQAVAEEMRLMRMP
jgi:hypothetical protein